MVKKRGSQDHHPIAPPRTHPPPGGPPANGWGGGGVQTRGVATPRDGWEYPRPSRYKYPMSCTANPGKCPNRPALQPGLGWSRHATPGVMQQGTSGAGFGAAGQPLLAHGRKLVKGGAGGYAVPHMHVFAQLSKCTTAADWPIVLRKCSGKILESSVSEI